MGKRPGGISPEKNGPGFSGRRLRPTGQTDHRVFSVWAVWRKTFSVRLDKTIPEEAPFYALVLQPKIPQPDLNQIHLRVSKTSFLPLEFTFFNILGDGTRFRFSQVQTAVKVNDAVFQFTPPKGVQVSSPSPVIPKNNK